MDWPTGGLQSSGPYALLFALLLALIKMFVELRKLGADSDENRASRVDSNLFQLVAEVKLEREEIKQERERLDTQLAELRVENRGLKAQTQQLLERVEILERQRVRDEQMIRNLTMENEELKRIVETRP